MDQFNVLEEFDNRIFYVRRKRDNRRLQVKKYPNCRREEIQLLLDLDHPNLVLITDIFIEENSTKKIFYLKKSSPASEDEYNELDFESRTADSKDSILNDISDLVNFCYVVSEFPLGVTLKHLILYQRKQLKESDGLSLFLSGGEYLSINSSDSQVKNNDNFVFSTDGTGKDSLRYFRESRVLHIFCRVFNALEYLHEKKIFHQNVSSSNIFLDKLNVVKIGLPDLLSYESSKKNRSSLILSTTKEATSLQFFSEDQQIISSSGIENGSRIGLHSTHVPLMKSLNRENDFSTFNSSASKVIFEEKNAENSSVDDSFFTMSQEKIEREKMWTLGCLLYEVLSLNEIFDDPSLEIYLDNVLQKTYKPIPEIFSLEVKELVAGLLNSDEDKRWKKEDVISFPFLQPIFREVANEEKMVRLFFLNRKSFEEEEATARVQCISEELILWRKMEESHIQFMKLVSLKEKFLKESKSTPLQILVFDEKKERIPLNDNLESMERKGIEELRSYELSLILRAEAHLRQILFMELIVDEITTRTFIEDIEEPFLRTKLRSLIATNRLILELGSFSCLTSSSISEHRHKVPPLPRLPPLSDTFDSMGSVPQEVTKCFHRTTFFLDKEKQNNEEKLDCFLNCDVVKSCVKDGANLLFKGDKLKRPILHELMRRGDINALRIALSTKQPLDFTTQDDNGYTPLHWIFCCCKTVDLLHAILDRLLVTHKHWDIVNWSIQDNQGNDFLSLAAHYGTLASVWRVLQERRVRFFRMREGRIVFQKCVRLGDIEQIKRKDRRRFSLLKGI